LRSGRRGRLLRGLHEGRDGRNPQHSHKNGQGTGTERGSRDHRFDSFS
jgi:hypothetical protein